MGFSRRVGTLGELEWKAEGILKLRTLLVRMSSPQNNGFCGPGLCLCSGLERGVSLGELITKSIAALL